MRLILAAIGLMFGLAVAWADNASPAFQTVARNAILLDAKSGHVFFEKDADVAVPPASMSKLMTQSIIFELLKNGQLKLDQEMTVSKEAAKRGGAAEGSSTMFANPGSRVSVENLLRGAIIDSGNDACIALAEGVAGTEEAFALRMQAKAKELGLTHSSFANATGLPDPNQLMSVRDLSVVARHIMSNYPDFYKIYSEPEFTWNKIKQQNRNPLLKDYPGADGMKTGFTKDSGYGLVGSAFRDGRRLVVVVAGLESVDKRRLEASKLLDFGFSQFRTISLFEAGDVVTQARVWGGEVQAVNLVSPTPLRIALATYESDKAELKVTFKGPLKAPLKAGEEVGSVRVVLDGKPLIEQPVQIEKDIAASNSMWRKAADSALILFFGG